ncbi:MAG: hypothetical protein ACPG5B_12105 [Chitinophagales bacterium]
MKNILSIFLLFSLFACHQKKNESDLQSKFKGVKWENSKLDAICFGNSTMTSKTATMPLFAFGLNYKIQSDTILLNNSDSNWNDSISLLKIEYLNKDTLKLKRLNDFYEKFSIFNEIENLTFYNSKTLDRFSYYVEKDSLCDKEAKQAKTDVENGNLVLCWHRRWPFRQKKEFIALLKKHDILYKYLGAAPDVPPYERDCYKETMDYYIAQKYNRHFFDSLLAEADTLLLRSNETTAIPSHMCDGGSRITNFYVRTELPPIQLDTFISDGNKKQHLQYPFMDINFDIDTIGEVSNFTIDSFVTTAYNEQFKDVLFELAIIRIKENPRWKIGKILGERVRTNHNIRIYF